MDQIELLLKERNALRRLGTSSAEFGNSFEGWRCVGFTGLITSGADYPIAGTLQFTDPVTDTTVGASTEVVITFILEPFSGTRAHRSYAGGHRSEVPRSSVECQQRSRK